MSVISPSPVLQARGLYKRFGGTTVVDRIDLDIRPGECFGILGPNGAGKTTTMRMMLGLSPMDGGSLEIFGLPMPAAAERVRARLGVVPQMDNLDPDFTVAENLRIYGKYFGLEAAVLAERIGKLLDFVELADRADTRIATLSGGMKRRLTIARALVNEPELVLLDEPTTGLDPQARHVIWQRLRALRQAGKTLVLTTHYMEEAERLCDRLVIMDHGRILAEGSPQALIAAHVPAEVVEMRSKYGGHMPPLDQLPAHLYESREVAGDTVFFYVRDAEPLLEAMHRLPDIITLNRPANLEDVFLKLTGRDLRD
ncbi:MAG: ATP-binding cassette domain-containing protein [Pseudomonadota bacterium]|uniref:ATP-binding cassette domain-containing protein n=1 Tax=Thermithiobacillus tepidarius TaxID=929 RepID=UPI0003FD9D83|nr:ATP-binding cassette domain-containing protein [Thermithiobacillus tepidarius]